MSSGGTKVLRDRKLSPQSNTSKSKSIDDEQKENSVDNQWYTSEQMLEKIKNDHSLGLDRLYRGKIIH
jgi:hypothetical protein